MTSITSTKRCKNCRRKATKPKNNPVYKYGYCTNNPECKKMYSLLIMKKWKDKNPDKVREYQKRWRDKNTNKIKEYNKQWHTKNTKRVLIQVEQPKTLLRGKIQFFKQLFVR